jgi:hypothetical protein
MTGTAVDGHRRGPPGRLGLAWLLDTVAQQASAPVAQVDRWAAEGVVTREDPGGREVCSRPEATARRPDAGPVSRPGSC